MPNQVIIKTPLRWAVPLTVAAVTVFTISKVKSSSMMVQAAQPLVFVPSGEEKFDSANMDHIRAEWHRRNNGIGLRDVSRSGGGV